MNRPSGFQYAMFSISQIGKSLSWRVLSFGNHTDRSLAMSELSWKELESIEGKSVGCNHEGLALAITETEQDGVRGFFISVAATLADPYETFEEAEEKCKEIIAERDELKRQHEERK